MPSTIISPAVIHTTHPNIQSVPSRKADILQLNHNCKWKIGLSNYPLIMIIDIFLVPLNLFVIVVKLQFTISGETLSPEVDRIFSSLGSSVLPINKIIVLKIIRGEHLLVISQNSILASCIILLSTVVNTKSTNPVVCITAYCNKKEKHKVGIFG